MAKRRKRRRFLKYKLNDKGKKAVMLLLLIILLVVAIVFGLVQLFKQNETKVKEPSVVETIAPSQESEIVETIEPTIEVSATPLPQPENTPIVDESGEFDPSVPESGPADISLLDGAVFIGDSRVEGFINLMQLDNVINYSKRGRDVKKVIDEKDINIDGNYYTVLEALEFQTFDTVYIKLGINETGWIYPDLFIEKYEQIITRIQEINPDCTIYIQSILPVSYHVSSTHEYITIKKINHYNELLYNLASRKHVYYLDVASVLKDENGYLFQDAASDGIHLKKEYCQMWLEYLLSHRI